VWPKIYVSSLCFIVNAISSDRSVSAKLTIISLVGNEYSGCILYGRLSSEIHQAASNLNRSHYSLLSAKVDKYELAFLEELAITMRYSYCVV
jgi:hypothetical protein